MTETLTTDLTKTIDQRGRPPKVRKEQHALVALGFGTLDDRKRFLDALEAQRSVSVPGVQELPDVAVVAHMTYTARGANMNDITRCLASATKSSGVAATTLQAARGFALALPDEQTRDTDAGVEPDPTEESSEAPPNSRLGHLAERLRADADARSALGWCAVAPFPGLFWEQADGRLCSGRLYEAAWPEPPRTEEARNDALRALISEVGGRLGGRRCTDTFGIRFTAWSRDAKPRELEVLHVFDATQSITELAPVLRTGSIASLGPWSSVDEYGRELFAELTGRLAERSSE